MPGPSRASGAVRRAPTSTLRAALVLVLGLSATSVAPAQDEQEPEPLAPEVESIEGVDAPGGELPGGIESIAITGEREVIQDVQDEAAAITAFSADDLDKANIYNIDSLQFSVPGLHVGQQGQQAIVTLRGIGTENATLTGEPGVAFHVDGINFARPAAARVAFFDLEGIQVKRGPQGLLGGKNSTSGAIHLVTNKPHEEYETTGDVLVGNHDRVRVRGAVNVPLGELAAVRFAGFYEDRDGYLDNVFLNDSRDPFDVDNFGLRAQLRLTPTPSLDVNLAYSYFKETGNGPQQDIVPIRRDDPCKDLNGIQRPLTEPRASSVMPVIASCAVRFDPDLGRPVFDPAIEDDDPRKIWADNGSAQDDRYWGWTSTVDWEVPELPVLGLTQLKALGGYQRMELVFDQDFDGTNLPLFDIGSSSIAHQYSSELQWSGTVAERLNWQSSLFFMRETGQLLANVPQTMIDVDQTVDNKSYGAALHGEYYMTEALVLSGGLRWIKDRKRTKLLRLDTNRKFLGCEGDIATGLDLSTGQLVPVGDVAECEDTFRNVAWGARVEWRPADYHLLYAAIDRGHKSGGFNAAGFGSYVPESVWTYAAGFKSEFFDSRLQLNVEGFFNAYENMQLVLIDGLKFRTENTDARMYGWDLEAKLAPIDGLRIAAVVSYLNTETRDYLTLDPAALDVFEQERLGARDEAEEDANPVPFNERTAASCTRPVRNPFTGLITSQNVPCSTLGDVNGLDDFSGNQLSRAPEWEYSISAEYDIPLGDWGLLTPRVQYTWRDDTYFRVFNRSFDLEEDFHQTDVKLTWLSPEEKWTAEVFVDNIEDEAPKQNILISSRAFGSPPMAWYGPPRFYGVRVGFRY